MIRALLIAGNETTATALGNLFYILATQPEVAELLQSFTGAPRSRFRVSEGAADFDYAELAKLDWGEARADLAHSLAHVEALGRGEIAARGPLSSEDFTDTGRSRAVWGAATQAKTTLQKLFFHGRLLIARRDNGNRRYYDLPERVLPARILALPIHAYRLILSPWVGHGCRFQPTCSAYALDALARHGALRGSWLALRRIGRCHPWGGHGYDPVPGADPEFDRTR